MPMPTTSEAIKVFLGNLPINYAQDLTDQYEVGMEVQVMCDPTGGEAVYDGDKLVRNTYEVCDDDYGTYCFHPIRIPKKAMSEPYWNDTAIRFPIQRHVESIGMTGWNWKLLKSKWVAFDFDSIVGHAAGVGVSDEELDAVREAACKIPWIQVRKSTGGSGLHLYVFFDPNNLPDCENHTVHAGLARCILGLMEREAGFDFRGAMDVLGGNMWVWRRDIDDKNKGLKVLKDYEVYCPDLPDNWKDNVQVVSGKTSKVVLRGISDVDQDAFELQAVAKNKVPLDDVHTLMETRIHEMGYSIVWVTDHWCWQTHTKAFKDLLEKFPEDYDGLFETVSGGKDPGKPNCLAGDTGVVTRQGVKPIRDLAGKTAIVLTTQSKWVEVPFKSFGHQELLEVTLQKGKSSKTIKATPEHGWFVIDRAQTTARGKIKFTERHKANTSELVVGDKLVQLHARPLKGLNVLVPSLVGIQHGCVWGDGCAKQNNAGNKSFSKVSTLELFGKKIDDLLPLFSGHCVRETQEGVEIWNLPGNFKSKPPLDYDKPYLYGWLAGYFATDGHVDKNGVCIIRSVDRSSIKHIRDICYILGIESSPITENLSDEGSYKPGTSIFTTCLKRTYLEENFFLMQHHLERFLNATDKTRNSFWTVVDVTQTASEEVFCCEVPDTHCFVLDDSILTSNCFVNPMKNGQVRINKFGRGAKEHTTWNQDGSDWTWTTFNKPPTLDEAASHYEGCEDPDGKGWVFTEIDQVEKVVDMLGGNLNLDTSWRDVCGRDERNITMKANKANQLVIEMAKQKDEHTPKGWIAKGRKFIKLYKTVMPNEKVELVDQLENYDDTYRAVTTTNGAFESWYLRNNSGIWNSHNKDNLRSQLKLLPDPGLDTETLIGGFLANNWTSVCIPFQPTYLGNRMWNRGAPQLAYQPAEYGTPHEHWDMVLAHCGQDLDKNVAKNQWCIEAGIRDGADYLTMWLAFILRDPYCKLPYLFMFGPQNSGKSVFHEAASKLMTGGWTIANEALTNSGNFNGELNGAVLCVVEEVDLSGSGSTYYNRMKAWVTGQDILIHAKKIQAISVRNCSHWVHCANHKSYCPVFPGDTRITMMHVPMLSKSEIPKDILMAHLVKEAPAMMRTLMDLRLPAPPGRLRLPIIITMSKQEAEDFSRDPVQRCLEDDCHQIPGAVLKLKDFYSHLRAGLSQEELGIWTNNKVASVASSYEVVYGRGMNNTCMFGNLSLKPKQEGVEYGLPWIQAGIGKVVRVSPEPKKE